MRQLIVSVSILLLLLYSCKQSSNKAKNNNDSFLGSWKMVAEQEVDSTGRINRQDTKVSGLLVYTPEGKMSVQLLYNGTRKHILTDSIMNYDGVSNSIGLGANTWTSEQAKTFIDTYDAYFGDYSIDWQNSIVTHVITGNLRPEKIGTIYKRRFNLNGDTLFLRDTKPDMKWRIVWVRNRK
jgi:hypothetical protein